MKLIKERTETQRNRMSSRAFAILTLDFNPHDDFYWESGKRTFETKRIEPIIVETKGVEISFIVSPSLSHTHKLQE